MIAQTAEAIQQTCAKCLRCGRVLRAARSVGRQVGPTCARKMKAAGIELPDAQPAAEAAPVASNIVVFARPVRVTEKVRTSAKIPGLTLEISTAGGRTCVSFNYGAASECYQLAGGRAYCVDCSDRYGFPPAVGNHVRQVADAMAAKLAEVAL